MKTKHHEIDLEGLESWMAENETLFASSSRERKRLICTMNGMLRIYVANVLKWEGTQPSAAVAEYNEITEQYVKPEFTL